MAGLIDSHCHLTSPELFTQIETVLDRARAAGVCEFVTIATDIADAHLALHLAASHTGVHVACGIHPHQASKAEEGWDQCLLTLARREDVVAVGEMGLDFHYDFADRPAQLQVFRRQLAIASETGKPVIIHCREAHEDALRTLSEFPGLKGVVFHCFTGTLAQACAILRCGYWLSLTGVVTFKRSDELREVARLLPPDRIMIETDAPYLSPEPVRIVRPNEPAHLVHIGQCIADVRGITLDDLTRLAASNTRRFFNFSDR
jgi:TatD DNase family protein